MMELLFWILVALIAYTYFGYPLLLFLISAVYRKPIRKSEDFLPSISLIITAHNEEEVIEDKIKNALSLDYPKEKLEIIIGSDSSTDRTDSIVRKYSKQGVILNRMECRKGKTSTVNSSAEIAKGEILVFSDADSIFGNNALKKLVRNFNDRSVGCVGGQVVYIPASQDTEGEKSYFHYEKWIREKESSIGSAIGASGAIYAVRKSLFEPIHPECDDDFIIPLICSKKGSRTLFEPKAVARIKLKAGSSKQFNTRVRVVIRGFNSLLRNKSLLLHPLLFFKLLSHKILRWMVGFFLLLIFISNITLLGSIAYRLIFYLQLIFYLSSFIGFLSKRKNLFYYPYYYMLTNLAASVAFLKLLKGEKKQTW